MNNVKEKCICWLVYSDFRQLRATVNDTVHRLPFPVKFFYPLLIGHKVNIILYFVNTFINLINSRLMCKVLILKLKHTDIILFCFPDHSNTMVKF